DAGGAPDDLVLAAMARGKLNGTQSSMDGGAWSIDGMGGDRATGRPACLRGADRRALPSRSVSSSTQRAARRDARSSRSFDGAVPGHPVVPESRHHGTLVHHALSALHRHISAADGAGIFSG